MTNLSYLRVSLDNSNDSVIFSENSWMENLDPLLEITMLFLESSNKWIIYIYTATSIITFIYLPWGPWKHSKPVSQQNSISSLHLWTNCLDRILFVNKTCSIFKDHPFCLLEWRWDIWRWFCHWFCLCFFIKKTEIQELISSHLHPPIFSDNPYLLMEFEADQHK